MSKTTTKEKKTSSTASAFTSVAAQLLLGRGGREAANNGDSIEFFSDLRKCQPEPRVSAERGGPGRTEDGRGMTRRRSSSDDMLSSEIGKHDYDWLLTPPASPLLSPAATSASGHQVSTTAPNQLAGPGSASFAKSNSRLGRTRGREKENQTSRLARSSSAAQPAYTNTPAIPPSGSHLSHIRTLSSASVSSINTIGSNASVISTPPLSSPRTPVTARSAARPCRRDGAASGNRQATGSVVARQPWALSSSSSNPTFSRRERATPSSSASSPRSTTSTCQRVPPPTPSRRANHAARSRLVSQSGGSRAKASSCTIPNPTTSQPGDVHIMRGARALPSSTSDGIKARAVPAASLQRWRQSLGPAIAAARSEESALAENGSPRTSGGGRKIASTDDKATARRPSKAAAGGGLARTGSANSSAPAANDGRPHQDASKHGGAAPAHHRKPTLLQQQWSSRSVSRLGLTRTTSGASTGSIPRDRSTPENGRLVTVHAAAEARIVSGPDAFPSTRYDAMLLREDPRNLTWLRGCDQGDDASGGGIELVDGALEPFDVATGLGGTAVRI